MSKKHIIFALLAILSISLFLVGCGVNGNNATKSENIQENTSAPTKAPQTDSNSLEQKYYRTDKGEGGVKVGVLLGDSAYFQATGNEQMITDLDLENNIVFEISMTTHSGDLRDYPMMENAELNVGELLLKPTKWEWTSKDSHHPASLLFFPAKDEAGKQLLKKSAVLELNLKDLRDVPERRFSWEI